MSPGVVPGGIDEYIAKSPVALRDALNAMRLAIREAAPDPLETLSYFQIPGFCYEGHDYDGMFAWFSFKGPLVRLRLRA